MRLKKLLGALTIVCLSLALFACGDTVSSTLASDNDGLDAIPGYNPGKTNGSKADTVSSSSAQVLSSDGGSSVAESSSSEDQSSSSEVEVDFSKSKIQVDGSGIAMISSDFLDAVSDDLGSELESLWEQLYDMEEPPGFEESKKKEFSVDELDFGKNRYFCRTESEDWYEITKEKLLETALPFLWEQDFYEYRDRYLLNFDKPCQSIYTKLN